MRAHDTVAFIESVLDQPARAAVSCSFQAGGVALVHMLRRYEPDMPVLFVDTGYHFPETLWFRDELAAAWDLDLHVLTSGESVGAWEASRGVVHRTDPDRCCAVRKVEPLYDALEDFDLWLTGVRRAQAPTRADTRPWERKLLPSGHVIEKANPIVDWTWGDVLSYHETHDLPLHPLHRRGYESIGCAPCTALVSADDPRAGRWDGAKVECGLHTMAEDLT